MLKRHLPNLLTYFLYRITNATTEGFNSVIQALKYAARGTRLPLLRQLPDSNPVLLREARSQAAATLRLKSRKNPIFAGTGNPSWSGSPMLTQGRTEWNGYHPDKTCPY